MSHRLDETRWMIDIGQGGYLVRTVTDPLVCLYGFAVREYAEDAVTKLNALVPLRPPRRESSDRLEEIKGRILALPVWPLWMRQDSEWLIAEVERLRAEGTYAEGYFAAWNRLPDGEPA